MRLWKAAAEARTAVSMRNGAEVLTKNRERQSVGSAALCFCLDIRPEIVRKNVQVQSAFISEKHVNKK